jgi:hypothetical protein
MNHFILKILLLISSTLLLFQSCSDDKDSPLDNNLPDNLIIYRNVMSYQTNYLRLLQLRSGAIKDNEAKESKICPYFANFACLALLKDQNVQNLTMVRNYMYWYINKLNDSVNPINGGDEIPGSIYDYYGDTETTNGTYDSVDSYAATFLMLAREYANCSQENKKWLQQYVDKLTLISSAMVKCIDTEYNTIPGYLSTNDNDGLSIASHVYDAKYLMDNCEVNQGLKAAKWLKENQLISDDFSLLLNKQTLAIESELWRGTSYNWFDNGSTTAISKWEVFYPDAVSQLYPALFGIIAPFGDRANKLYALFNHNYPNWSKGEVYSGDYPWTLLAYTAASINDNTRVDEYIQHIYSYNMKGLQKDYWYSLEAAFIILAIDKVINKTSIPSYILVD